MLCRLVTLPLKGVRSIIIVVRSANSRFDRGAINDYSTVMSRTVLSSWLFAAFLLGPTVVTAHDDETSSARCALLDLSKSPVAALTEAKLSAQAGTTWLERTEIDKVMAEQELTTLLGAKAASGRIALGQVLKADILVLLETKLEQKKRFAKIVVAETSGGLRLLSTKVPLTDDVLTDADQSGE